MCLADRFANCGDDPVDRRLDSEMCLRKNQGCVAKPLTKMPIINNSAQRTFQGQNVSWRYEQCIAAVGHHVRDTANRGDYYRETCSHRFDHCIRQPFGP